MTRPFGQIIGELALNRVGTNGKAVTVVLGIPRRMTGGDWKCPFRITGHRVHYGYGVDAIQALTTALEGIRVRLEASGQELTWLDGKPG